MHLTRIGRRPIAGGKRPYRAAIGRRVGRIGAADSPRQRAV